MELWLWITYLSSEVWLVGLLLVQLPLGCAIYGWLWLYSWIQLFQVFDESDPATWDDWFAGPFMRSWIVGPFIYWTSFILAIIPGVNFASAFYMGWWAQLDYYEYQYELWEGPILPEGYVPETA